MAVLKGREEKIMAIVITNGEYYIYLNQVGEHRKQRILHRRYSIRAQEKLLVICIKHLQRQMAIMYMILLLIVWYGND